MDSSLRNLMPESCKSFQSSCDFGIEANVGTTAPLEHRKPEPPAKGWRTVTSVHFMAVHQASVTLTFLITWKLSGKKECIIFACLKVRVYSNLNKF